MNRPAVRIAALTIALLPGLALATEATSPDVAYASIDQLQQRMDAGALDSLSLGAGILEFAGGILLALGLFTRPVALLLSGEMAIAYFTAHMPRDFFPVNNGGDAAISFCFVFLYLVFAGPGAFALDNRRG